jgi:hypothetical protein
MLTLVQLLQSSKERARLAFHCCTGSSDSSFRLPVSQYTSNWGRTSLRGRAQRWYILSKLTLGQDISSLLRSPYNLCCCLSAVAMQLVCQIKSMWWRPGLTRPQVFSQYIFRMAGRAPAAWEQKGVAIAGYTAAVVCKSPDP